MKLVEFLNSAYQKTWFNSREESGIFEPYIDKLACVQFRVRQLSDNKLLPEQKLMYTQLYHHEHSLIHLSQSFSFVLKNFRLFS